MSESLDTVAFVGIHWCTRIVYLFTGWDYDCDFFIATSELYGIQCKCSNSAIVTMTLIPTQPISCDKEVTVTIASCEQVLSRPNHFLILGSTILYGVLLQTDNSSKQNEIMVKFRLCIKKDFSVVKIIHFCERPSRSS